MALQLAAKVRRKKTTKTLKMHDEELCGGQRRWGLVCAGGKDGRKEKG